MTNDNVKMWTELGIDLEKHDSLLNALRPIYQEVYLSPKNRPEGMAFFDFVVGDIHGIRVRELRQLESQGVEILACGTCLSRLELMDKIAVGQVSNMYTLADTLLKAKKMIAL